MNALSRRKTSNKRIHTVMIAESTKGEYLWAKYSHFRGVALERHTHSISSDAVMMQSYMRSERHPTGVRCRFRLIVNLDVTMEGTRRANGEWSGAAYRKDTIVTGKVSEASKEKNSEGISLTVYNFCP
jgi:hypothetical protein